ncbi:hypothetical protein NKOR_05300 [Candidatus Nitrosopumilus koreensis AR1]|uniref:Uncharacterized protein n=1 Tax=Candidatus Nitrosopumilus koreensis AR1 TaxID=1229908 RepID=K0B943_9ARCH|nr:MULTISPECIES: hypothetical protein [Nitrosopumilus]AFS80946.1 hypothetical protein NKOR_05300 [Candidatus Nitrosopumilus koreensis AR1]
MNCVSEKLSLKNRRAVSQVMGSLVILGIVTSVGSVILFNGMSGISAFTYDLSFHEKSKNQIHREDIVFEHVRFEPNTDDISIDLANIGTVESTISTITILKIDNQEIIANWVEVNQIIFAKENQKIMLDTDDDSEIQLTPISAVWNDANYLNSEYKISLTTARGNFFTTVASPFNT